MIALRLATALALIAALASCRDEAGPLSADTVDFPWPFTVGSGDVECRAGLEIVFVSGDDAYPLNGAASANAAARGYRALEDIWRADPDTPGARISTAPMLRLGLDKCAA